MKVPIRSRVATYFLGDVPLNFVVGVAQVRRREGHRKRHRRRAGRPFEIHVFGDELVLSTAVPITHAQNEFAHVLWNDGVSEWLTRDVNVELVHRAPKPRLLSPEIVVDLIFRVLIDRVLQLLAQNLVITRGGDSKIGTIN